MNRPYIKLWHFVLEILGFVLILASLIYAIYLAVTVKEPVPVRIEFDGTVTDYGSASFVLFMPITMLLTNVLLFCVLHFSNPAKWNNLVKVTPANAPYIHMDESELFAEIEALFGVYTLFFTLTFLTNTQFDLWGTIVMVVVLFVLCGVNIAKTFKHGKITG